MAPRWRAHLRSRRETRETAAIPAETRGTGSAALNRAKPRLARRLRWWARMIATHVYFTKNTEYHVASGICVRVMRRDDGRRLSDHPAVGAKLLGGVHFPTTKPVLSSLAEPLRGDCLVFAGDDGLVLSTILDKTETRDAAGVVLTENGEDVATWRRRRA